MLNHELSRASTGDKIESTRPLASASLVDSTLVNASLADVKKAMQLSGEIHIDVLPALSISEDEHTVKKGETVSGIASDHLGKHASSNEIYNLVKELAKHNLLQDVNQIHPGERIRFPESHQHLGDRSHNAIDPHMSWADKAVDPQMMWTDKAINPQMPSTDKALDPRTLWTDTAIDPHMLRTDNAVDPQMPSTHKAVDPQMPWTDNNVDPQMPWTDNKVDPQMPWLDSPTDQQIRQRQTSSDPQMPWEPCEPKAPWSGISDHTQTNKPEDKTSTGVTQKEGPPQSQTTGSDNAAAHAHQEPAAVQDTSHSTDKAPAPNQQPEEPQGIFGFFNKVGAVAHDIGTGIAKEICNHPDTVLENAAAGVAIGVGATLLAPEIAVGAAVVGIGIGAYELASHAGAWAHAADVVANSHHYSTDEQKAAHAELNQVGAGLTDLAAGCAGGAVASIGMKALAGEAALEAGAAAHAGRASQAAAESEAAAVGRAESSLSQPFERPSFKTASEGEAGPASPTERAPNQSTEASPARTAPNRDLDEAGPASDASLSTSDSALAEPVKVESLGPGRRQYTVGDKIYSVSRLDAGPWFSGKYVEVGDIVGPVKLHVSVGSPEDLARLQRVLIPWLSENAEANDLAVSWKTFDPNHAFGTGDPPSFVPDKTGQNAKGFTIYTKAVKNAVVLQQKLDAELSKHGLDLTQPYDTGNVDVIEGSSNRVGIVRDYYPRTKDLAGNTGARLDIPLARQIEADYAQGGHLNDSQLRAVEERAGLRADSLGYDKDGNLMLKLTGHKTSVGHPGQVYVPESGAEKTAGNLTNRPAIYALARAFEWDLVGFLVG